MARSLTGWSTSPIHSTDAELCADRPRRNVVLDEDPSLISKRPRRTAIHHCTAIFLALHPQDLLRT